MGGQPLRRKCPPDIFLRLGREQAGVDKLIAEAISAPSQLRNNIGDQVILDHRDLVFQSQLALLQPGDLELVG